MWDHVRSLSLKQIESGTTPVPKDVIELFLDVFGASLLDDDSNLDVKDYRELIWSRNFSETLSRRGERRRVEVKKRLEEAEELQKQMLLESLQSESNVSEVM